MKTDKIIKCIREIEKSKKVKIDVNTIIYDNNIYKMVSSAK